MGILDKLRSIQWRFPKREEPTLPESRMILAPENDAQAGPEHVVSMTAPDETSYAKIRRFTRYSMEGRGIHAHMLFSEEVSLYDVSVNGACIHTMKDLRIGGKYLINIQDGKRAPYIRCRAVWRRESISDVNVQQGYMAGLQFQEIAPDELVRLKDFMRTDGVPDEKRVSDAYEPSPLRFMIVSKRKATLKLPTILNVRKISLGGMLIESDSALGLEGRYPVKLPLPRESADKRGLRHIACTQRCHWADSVTTSAAPSNTQRTSRRPSAPHSRSVRTPPGIPSRAGGQRMAHPASAPAGGSCTCARSWRATTGARASAPPGASAGAPDVHQARPRPATQSASLRTAPPSRCDARYLTGPRSNSPAAR